MPTFVYPALPKSWQPYLQEQFALPYMQQLAGFLSAQLAQGALIFPPSQQIFAALQAVDFAAVKVVILGQDPYHGEHQAEGMAFSVPEGVAIPPSLQNIFKERYSDVAVAASTSGSLQSWAEQGVLLLNSVLTVECGKAGAHQQQGWEIFTDAIIAALNEQHEHLVFILWGAYAQKKGRVIDRQRHLVLQSVHPSPLSAYRGFFGSQPFSKTNHYLSAQGKSPIRW
jgi:uracil-DNA glycosylase